MTKTGGQDVDEVTENGSADARSSLSACWLAYFSLIFAIVSVALYDPPSLDSPVGSAFDTGLNRVVSRLTATEPAGCNRASDRRRKPRMGRE
jgi:hypothetical protein